MKDAKWITILKALLFCICCAFALIVLSSLTKNIAKPWSDLVLGTTACIAAFIITVLFARSGKIKLNDLGVVPQKKSAAKFFVGFLAGLYLAVVHWAIATSFGDCQISMNKNIAVRQILIMLLLYFVLALREELAFRGYPLRVLDWKIGLWQSQILVAFVFALEHFAGGYNFSQAFLGAALGAILFGMAAIRTNGIALPTGLHLAWNFGQWCLGFKDESGIVLADVKDKVQFEQVTLTVYVVIFTLAIICFYFIKQSGAAILSGQPEIHVGEKRE